MACGNNICRECLQVFQGPFCSPACRQAYETSNPVFRSAPTSARRAKATWISIPDLLRAFIYWGLPLLGCLIWIALRVDASLNPPGAMLWSSEFDTVQEAPPVAIAGGAVVCATKPGLLQAFDPITGDPLWAQVIPRDAQAKAIYAISPSALVFQTDDGLYLVSVPGGRNCIPGWGVRPGGRILSMLASDAQSLVMVVDRSTDNVKAYHVQCLDSLKGTLRWKSPVVFAQLPQASFSAEYIYLLAPTVADLASGAALATAPADRLSMNATGVPLRQTLACIRRASGTLAWQIPVVSKTRIQIFAHSSGVLAATPSSILNFTTSGKLEWKQEFHSNTITRCGFDGWTFFFVDLDQNLHGFDTSARKESWMVPLGPPVSPFLFQDNRMLVVAPLRRHFEDVVRKNNDYSFDLGPDRKTIFTLVNIDPATGKTRWFSSNVNGTLRMLPDHILVWNNFASLPDSSLQKNPQLRSQSYCQCLSQTDGQPRWSKTFNGRLSAMDAGEGCVALLLTPRDTVGTPSLQPVRRSLMALRLDKRSLADIVKAWIGRLLEKPPS